MNLTVYLFGNLDSGYTQYPDDYTRSIFQHFCGESKAGTQLTIHRDGVLMYYGYTRMLEGGKCLGMCCVINGHYITDLKALFSACEHVVENMAREGAIICFDDRGDIISKVNRLYMNQHDIDMVTRWINQTLGGMDTQTAPLPAVNYAASVDSQQHFSLEDDRKEMVRSTYTNSYTFICKERGYNTPQMNSYRGVIMRKERKIDELQIQCKALQGKVSSLERQKRNTTWVMLLLLVVAVFGLVIWNRVLFPSEVTKKDMGEYTYYGPILDGKPNGVGVAIYHQDDKDGRRFYYGNFVNGTRVDDQAMLFYKDGSYYYGKMEDNKWIEGLFYDTEQEHFVGKFQENRPDSGTWYKHVKAQEVRHGN